MKKFIKNLAFGIGWSILILSGCTKDSLEDIPMDGTTQAETETVPQESSKFIQDSGKQVFNYIKSLGFDEADIVETSKAYFVEGDIRFAKDMVVPEPRKSGNGLTEHQYYSDISDSSTYVDDPSDITIKAGSGMSPYSNQINDAIQFWNNANWWVRFRRVTSGTADITILSDPSLMACARGDWPEGGQAGDTIWYNNNTIVSVANSKGQNVYQQQVSTIAHEMGHNIGFAHTNTTWGDHIPGTPTSDPHSIMNSGCGEFPSALSTDDTRALKYLYKAPVVTLNPSNINLSMNPSAVVSISGSGPVTVRLSGDPGLILFHGSSSGTTLNLTAPNTFEVHKQWGSGYSRIMLDSWGSNRDITYISF